MTKTIFITLEDEEHKKLTKRKGSLTWKEMLMRPENQTKEHLKETTIS